MPFYVTQFFVALLSLILDFFDFFKFYFMFIYVYIYMAQLLFACVYSLFRKSWIWTARTTTVTIIQSYKVSSDYKIRKYISNNIIDWSFPLASIRKEKKCIGASLFLIPRNCWRGNLRDQYNLFVKHTWIVLVWDSYEQNEALLLNNVPENALFSFYLNCFHVLLSASTRL